MQLKQCRSLYLSSRRNTGKQYIVLTDYKGSEEKITIPDQINGIEVKSIQDGFGKNSKLKSITLSKNIASEKDTKRSLAGLNQITTLEEIQTVKIMLHISQKMGFFTQRIKKNWLLIQNQKNQKHMLCHLKWKSRRVKFSKFKISKEPYIFKENKNNPRVFK